MLSLLLSLSIAWATPSAESLALETEKVWQSLKPDDPLKSRMQTRLADLYFDAATEIAGHGDLSDASEKKLNAYRARAQALYQSALANPSLKSSKRDQIRLQFQAARLMADLGQLSKAQSLWGALTEQEIELEIQRESALRLAEIKETSSNTGDLKQAAGYYQIAQKNCVKKAVCAYVQYRWAWVEYRLSRPDPALARLLKAIDIADSSSQKEMLKDMLVFVSHSSWDVKKTLELVRKWKSTGGPDENQLLSSYFSAGRRSEYRELLAIFLSEQVQGEHLISALEIDDQDGKLDLVRQDLSALEKISAKSAGNPSHEAEQKLYRTLVSWDGQREQKPQNQELYLRGSEVFLILFPKSADRLKVADGRMAVTTTGTEKIAWLSKWKQISLQNKDADLEKWTRQRLWQLGVQEKRSDLILQESSFLAAAGSAKAEDRREYLYQEGRAWMAQNELAKAKARFLELSDPARNPADDIQLFSLNLALGLAEKEKNFSLIVETAQNWLGHRQTQERCRADQKWAKDCAQVEDIRKKAIFQVAIQNNDRQSLQTFLDYCLKNEITPLSCQNAKVLARQFKEEAILIQVLQKEKDEKILASEFEYAGRFSDAARLQEKLFAGPHGDLKSQLKIAMLYEISGDSGNQLRIFRQILNAKKKGFDDGNQEALLYSIFRSSGLAVEEYYSLPWNETRKAELASLLPQNKEAKEFLGAKCAPLGPAWELLHLTSVREKETELAKISIVGRNSEKNFKKKDVLLGKLSTDVNCLLKGLSLEKQQQVAGHVSEIYGKFAQDIKSVPLPEGLDEAMKTQVQEQIAQMAHPYEESAAKWLALKGESQAPNQWPEAPVMPSPANVQMASVPETSIQRLQKDPDSIPLHQEIAKHYEDSGKPYLAAYFKDRALGLQKENR
jgi:hypothetical protein